MGETTDKIEGRAKQAVGAVTGDEERARSEPCAWALSGRRQVSRARAEGDLCVAVSRSRRPAGSVAGSMRPGRARCQASGAIDRLIGPTGLSLVA